MRLASTGSAESQFLRTHLRRRSKKYLITILPVCYGSNLSWKPSKQIVFNIDLLEQGGTKIIFADKSFGQHFLHDAKVIGKIVDTLPKEAEAMVEVGPGKGSLTRRLSVHPLPLYLIEKDERFAPLLSPLVPPGFIHFQDAMKMDFSLLPRKNIWLISNLPYNVSVPLTLKFLRCPGIAFMTLMFQHEVAEKILSPPMNSLMALIQNYFSCRRLLRVSPGAFSPPPQVYSSVVVFERLKSPHVGLEEFDRYEYFLRRLFNHKRKQMQKILRSLFPDGGGEALKRAKLEGSLRAESCNLAQIRSLYRQWEQAQP